MLSCSLQSVFGGNDGFVIPSPPNNRPPSSPPVTRQQEREGTISVKHPFKPCTTELPPLSNPISSRSGRVTAAISSYHCVNTASKQTVSVHTYVLHISCLTTTSLSTNLTRSKQPLSNLYCSPCINRGFLPYSDHSGCPPLR